MRMGPLSWPTAVSLALAVVAPTVDRATASSPDPEPAVSREAPAAYPAAVAQRWRTRIRSTLFVPEPAPALEPEALTRFEPEPGVTAERILYGTQFGMRVPAILYRPSAPKGRMPALIVINGHGGDKSSWYSFYTGVLYARAGAAVLTYDPVGEGERNRQRRSGTRAHDRQVDPEEIARRLGGLMMTDVIQAVSYLSQRPDVDPGRIGAVGYSLGSFVLALAGAVETRLHACVLVGGGNLDGPSGYWDTSKPMCQGLPYRSLAFLGDRPAALYSLHADRGPTLIANGLDDTVVAIPTHAEGFFADLRARVIRLRGGDIGVFEARFVPGASHRPYFVTRPVAAWLERQLDFPAWTDASIAALPETRVGTWAQARGVPLDRLYATEDREGGTHALGADIPGLSPAELSVLPPEEWERRKGRLIYESWLSEAQARSAAGPAAKE
jgi:dienelactone hydrolase